MKISKNADKKVMNNLPHTQTPYNSKPLKSYPHYPHVYTHFQCVRHVDFFVHNPLNIIRHIPTAKVAFFLQNSYFMRLPIIYLFFYFPHYPHYPHLNVDESASENRLFSFKKGCAIIQIACNSFRTTAAGCGN